MSWPTRERRGANRLCGCGKPRTVQVQIRADIRAGRPRNSPEQLGSVSRTVCEDCAQRLFHTASEAIVTAVENGVPE